MSSSIELGKNLRLYRSGEGKDSPITVTLKSDIELTPDWAKSLLDYLNTYCDELDSVRFAWKRMEDLKYSDRIWNTVQRFLCYVDDVEIVLNKKSEGWTFEFCSTNTLVTTKSQCVFSNRDLCEEALERALFAQLGVKNQK